MNLNIIVNWQMLLQKLFIFFWKIKILRICLPLLHKNAQRKYVCNNVLSSIATWNISHNIIHRYFLIRQQLSSNVYFSRLVWGPCCPWSENSTGHCSIYTVSFSFLSQWWSQELKISTFIRTLKNRKLVDIERIWSISLLDIETTGTIMKCLIPQLNVLFHNFSF